MLHEYGFYDFMDEFSGFSSPPPQNSRNKAPKTERISRSPIKYKGIIHRKAHGQDILTSARGSRADQIKDAEIANLRCHFVDRTGLTVSIAFSPERESATPAWAIGSARDLTGGI